MSLRLLGHSGFISARLAIIKYDSFSGRTSPLRGLLALPRPTAFCDGIAASLALYLSLIRPKFHIAFHALLPGEQNAVEHD